MPEGTLDRKRVMTSPAIRRRAKDMGVEIKVSDLDENRRITVELVE